MCWLAVADCHRLQWGPSRTVGHQRWADEDRFGRSKDTVAAQRPAAPGLRERTSNRSIGAMQPTWEGFAPIYIWMPCWRTHDALLYGAKARDASAPPLSFREKTCLERKARSKVGFEEVKTWQILLGSRLCFFQVQHCTGRCAMLGWQEPRGKVFLRRIRRGIR